MSQLFWDIVSITFSIIMILLLIAFFTKTSDQFSRFTVNNQALFTLGWLLFCHLGGRNLLRYLRVRGGNSRSVIYWGPAASACHFHQQLLTQPQLGLSRSVAALIAASITASAPPSSSQSSAARRMAK